MAVAYTVTRLTLSLGSPKRTKAWNEFWAKYKAEKALLEAFHRGELKQDVSLELLNMQLHVERKTNEGEEHNRPGRCT